LIKKGQLEKDVIDLVPQEIPNTNHVLITPVRVIDLVHPVLYLQVLDLLTEKKREIGIHQSHSMIQKIKEENTRNIDTVMIDMKKKIVTIKRKQVLLLLLEILRRLIQLNTSTDPHHLLQHLMSLYHQDLHLHFFMIIITQMEMVIIIMRFKDVMDWNTMTMWRLP
jgi:hypothetical protein